MKYQDMAVPQAGGSLTPEDLTKALHEHELKAQHQLLKDEVIAGAREWRDDWLLKSKRLRDAMDNLEAFELELQLEAEHEE
jgi:hypothetical protein